MPTTRPSRALAASIRLPNLPSVLSNTLTGAFLASELNWDASLLPRLLLACLAASCLYISGNLFNDWHDREWDAIHRPERALPQSLFSPHHYALTAIFLSLIAITACALASIHASITAATILGCILIYTWSHKRHSASVIPMALCRALLPVLGFLVVNRNTHLSLWLLLPSLMLFTYLIQLSLRARLESKTHTHTTRNVSLLGFLLPPAILLAFCFWKIPTSIPHLSPWLAIACLPYLLWTTLALTRYRHPISRQVSALLAGIPLIDSMLMLTLTIGHTQLGDDTSIALSGIGLLAFTAGRWLQRYVPAT